MSYFAADFPIVCVGGSAGAHCAYVQIVQSLPPDLGVAVVIVNHRINLPTALHQILARHAKLPVELITDRLRIRPGGVFIIASNRELRVFEGEFRLEPISKRWGWPEVISIFLHSLAQNWNGKLVAVIVSGMGGDGADALRRIKEVGGTTIAQSPDTAEWSDMPETAISTGAIDFVLSAQEIAEKIVQISQEFPGTVTRLGNSR